MAAVQNTPGPSLNRCLVGKASSRNTTSHEVAGLLRESVVLFAVVLGGGLATDVHTAWLKKSTAYTRAKRGNLAVL